MGETDQGTGGFDEAMPTTADFGEAPFRRAMGGDQDRFGVDVFEFAFEADPAAAEVAEDGFVMHEVAEDRDRVLGGFLLGEADGVADTETHTEMGGALDFHTCGL